jgi:ketosteroid isomerase-like protein
MPTRERVRALIDLVERGRFIDALDSFYHQDASIQENLDPPRHGLDTLVRGEQRVMAAHREIQTRPARMVLVEGDRVVINWIFDFVDHEGRAFTLDELALQLWRGERIIEERFYYDPAQRGRPAVEG